jgi:protein TonB
MTHSLTLGVSMVLHGLLVLSLVLVPILFSDALPPLARDGLRAFLMEPPTVAPPPPPPPPPPASALRATPQVLPVPEPVPTAARLVAPIEVPDQVVADREMGLDLGVEGGVPGGVEGGVPGGVVGGVVGGLPLATLGPAPPPVVRVGGLLSAPKLLRTVTPTYPALAVAAHVSAVIILEAHVDAHGNVKTATILRGSPLFDDAAVEAVKQWRYKPLLLNGVPTEFILTVTLNFRIQDAKLN